MNVSVLPRTNNNNKSSKIVLFLFIYLSETIAKIYIHYMQSDIVLVFGGSI